jgi:hypothetical protein
MPKYSHQKIERNKIRKIKTDGYDRSSKTVAVLCFSLTG